MTDHLLIHGLLFMLGVAGTGFALGAAWREQRMRETRPDPPDGEDYVLVPWSQFRSTSALMDFHSERESE